MADSDKSLDVLGVKPIAKSVEIVTEGSVKGAGAFLSRVCLPAAEEFGLLLQDKVRSWRAKNFQSIGNKAEYKYNKLPKELQNHTHPKIVAKIIESGSWEDNDEVQDLWVGLLSSACALGEGNQTNIIYIDILSRLTSSQAVLFEWICENSDKYAGAHGLTCAHGKTYEIPDLLAASSHTAISDLDLEVDHLREVGIIEGGIQIIEGTCEIAPTSLGLNFYVRCQGFIGTPAQYFGIEPQP